MYVHDLIYPSVVDGRATLCSCYENALAPITFLFLSRPIYVPFSPQTHLIQQRFMRLMLDATQWAFGKLLYFPRAKVIVLSSSRGLDSHLQLGMLYCSLQGLVLCQLHIIT